MDIRKIDNEGFGSDYQTNGWSTMTNNPVAVLQFKKQKISRALSKSVALVVRGSESLAVIIKSSLLVSFYERPEKNRQILIWAICGSMSDMRNFEVELQRFISGFNDTFSKRDLNIHIIKDFITSYLRDKFYDAESLEPVALEFIVGGTLDEGRVVFYTINHEGDLEPPDQALGNISLIGGGDSNCQRQLLKKLSDLGTEKLSPKKIAKIIYPHMKEYEGSYTTFIPFFFSEKSRTKNRNKNKKKTKK